MFPELQYDPEDDVVYFRMLLRCAFAKEDDDQLISVMHDGVVELFSAVDEITYGADPRLSVGWI